MRRRLSAVLVGLLIPAGMQAASAAAPKITASIGKVGQSVFWPGARAVSYQAYDIDPTQFPYYPPQYLPFDATAYAKGEKRYRWEYKLKIPAGGHRLRVAFDGPSAYEWHYLSITPPKGDGKTVLAYNSAELVADKPMAGIWTVGIFSGFPDNSFRLRARLEPKLSKGKGALLPNLKLIPPFEFTFANPYRGTFRLTGGDRVPAPDGVANCWWDEIVEHGARKCLRFSLGPINAGAGPLDLVFEGNGAGVATPGKVMQRIHTAEGTIFGRSAGESEFHKTHMHYHHMGFGELELWKVTNPKTGAMVRAGSGPKQGFCTADIIAYEWTRFAAVQHEAPSECIENMGPAGTFSPTGTQMGISAGWADIYDWSQSGNYVEFGDNTDGRYLVRSTTDAAKVIVESNESDNTSYAYIEVKGTSIKVLERGFGQSPWDKKKKLANDILRPTPAGFTS